MTYHCPHCQKISQTPDGLALAGFDIICGYCSERFTVPQEDMTVKDESHYAISCPNCDVRMRLSESEYDILKDHKLHCPNCTISLKLPPLAQHLHMPPSHHKAGHNQTISFAKFFSLTLIIIASIALFFTPRGQEIMSDLAQKLSQWRTPIWQIKSQWHEFIAFLQGFFL